MAIRLWIREDDEEPKALARDATRGPGPGRVVDVDARSSNEAREVYAIAAQAEPPHDTQPWLEWRQARKRVQEVTRG